MKADKIKLKDVKKLLKKVDYGADYRVDHENIKIQSAAMAKAQYEDVLKKVELGKKRFNSIFFIVVNGFTVPGLAKEAIREEINLRETWPHPECKQVVYKYNPDGGYLTLLWAIPDQKTCMALYSNRHNPNVTKHSLMPFVMGMQLGTFRTEANKYNSNLIIKE